MKPDKKLAKKWDAILRDDNLSTARASHVPNRPPLRKLKERVKHAQRREQLKADEAREKEHQRREVLPQELAAAEAFGRETARKRWLNRPMKKRKKKPVSPKV